MWVGLKERVRVRVISVRVRDHILPDMGEHQGLPGVLLPQRTVHLLHRALCSSTCGAVAGWGVHYYRVCSVLAQQYSKKMRRHRVFKNYSRLLQIVS